MSKTVRLKITIQEDTITVGSPPVRCSSPIFKCIMNKISIDIRTTSAAFYADICSIDDCIDTCNSNIKVFNTCVQHVTCIILERGHIFENMITELFKGNNIVTDVNFIACIDSWETSGYKETIYQLSCY